MSDAARRAGAHVSDAPPIEDVAGLAKAVDRVGPTWTVLDGYGFHAAHHEAIRSTGARLLVVDDHGAAGSHRVTAVLDQNLGASSADYQDRLATTTLLLGSRFALLRPSFRSAASNATSSEPERVFVAAGGNPDPAMLSMLADAVVAAGAKPVLADGSVADVVRLMVSCGVAVTTAGSTALELCALGIPMALLSVSANQRPVAHRLDQRGAGIDLGDAATLDPGRLRAVVQSLVTDATTRSAMAATGRSLVDGLGARRVVETLGDLLPVLREVVPEDAHVLWRWANDPATRQMSLSRAPISWAEHERWFADRLASANTVFLLAEEVGTPVGVARFDLGPDQRIATVSVTVAPDHRGRGLGRRIVDAATSRLFERTPVERIQARVRTENEASKAAFEHSGYVVEDRTSTVDGDVLDYAAHRTSGGYLPIL